MVLLLPCKSSEQGWLPIPTGVSQMKISKATGTVFGITVLLGLSDSGYAGDVCKKFKFQFIDKRDKIIAIGTASITTMTFLPTIPA